MTHVAALASAVLGVAMTTTIATSTASANDAAASQDGASGTTLTVYSSADPAGFDPQQFIAQQRGGYNPMFAWQVPGFGIVRETRAVELQAGASQLRFTDVAEFIDPTTVSFVDRTQPDTAILDQRFEFDLVSPSKLLEKYVDRDIVVYVPEGDATRAVAGTLLSATQGQLVMETPGGLEIVNAANARYELGPMPDGFVTRPTLVWNLNAPVGGNHIVETAYRTGGITWRADYNLVLSGDEKSVDLAAWVSLMNLSGASWQDARLKLVAGDVQTIQPNVRTMGRMRGGMAELAMADDGGFQEKAFFEYHLYTLPRAVDIDQNTVQQIALFPSRTGVPVAKELVYEGQSNSRFWSAPARGINEGDANDSNTKVSVFLRFTNDEASKMGVPLPKGRVRVMKADPDDGALEFVGEDLIDHTARDERVRVKLGESFDVVGDRTRTDFSVDRGRRTASETIRIEIRNRKQDEPVTVNVREHLWRAANWTIRESNRPHQKRDSNTIEFDVAAAPGGTSVVEYTVVYTW